MYILSTAGVLCEFWNNIQKQEEEFIIKLADVTEILALRYSALREAISQEAGNTWKRKIYKNPLHF